MKRSHFSHLFPEKEDPSNQALPTKSAKKVALGLSILFFLLYLKYKPYDTPPHQITSVAEQLFTLYQFILNQTLGIVHEGGHGVCYLLPCPTFVMVAMGTIFQWLFPLGIGYYYKQKGNLFAWYMGLLILGISMDYTAWYISTAPQGAILPASKSFLGVDALHDFHYLLSHLGLLSHALLISDITKMAAHLLMIGAVIAMFFEAF